MAFYWRPYVPVARRRAQAKKKIETLKKKGVVIQPIEIEGRKIAASFWGRAWCDHLESFSDYANRLPRGRTYVRNGSVCHLDIRKGRIDAMVSGSELYTVAIEIKPLKPTLWKSIKRRCSGKIGSMLELLQGRLSEHVMGIVTDRRSGLMPQPGEIKLSCSCPDWASMCKHVAAVLYGVGSRLDTLPDLLFTLRGVDAEELISAELTLPVPAKTAPAGTLADDKLSDVFGIELEGISGTAKPRRKKRSRASVSNKRMSAKSPVRKRKTSGKVKASQTKKRKRTSLEMENITADTVSLLQVRLGLSVSQLAGRLNVTPATIYNWRKKSGRLNLRPQTRDALVRLEKECH